MIVCQRGIRWWKMCGGSREFEPAMMNEIVEGCAESTRIGLRSPHEMDMLMEITVRLYSAPISRLQQNKDGVEPFQTRVRVFD